MVEHNAARIGSEDEGGVIGDRVLSCREGHHNYTIPRVQSPEIMQSRHDPIEGQLSRAGETRQPEKKKEKAGPGVESGDVATAHCLHSFGKRQRAEPPPAVCLSVFSVCSLCPRPASLTLGPLSAFTHFLLQPRIYMTLVKPTSSLTSSDHCHKSLFRCHSRGPATFQICFVTRFTTRTPTPDKGNLTFHFAFLVYTLHQIHANRKVRVTITVF